MRSKRIIVTGGAGFLGGHIVRLLKERGHEVFVPRSREYDLTNPQACEEMFKKFGQTDIVIHAAADIGGIGYSSTNSAKQFYNNTLINLNIVHSSWKNKIEKFVGIGSVCEYPDVTPVPFVETELWNGYPVSTNDAYGLTKRMLLAQCIAYKKQYGFNSIHLLPVNMYGPGDDFDLHNSHVIPALIRKVVYAMDNNINVVEVWGTGYESREFIYIEDVADAVVMSMEKYNKLEPVNIGSGVEIQIYQIAEMIKKALGYTGEFLYLNNGLGGQQRRLLDVTKAKNEFGFVAKTTFEVGIQKTIEYYINNKENIV